MTEVIDFAVHNGVNYFDMAPFEQAPFYAYARAFWGRRESIVTVQNWSD